MERRLTASSPNAVEDYLKCAEFWAWEIDSDLVLSHLSERFEVLTGIDPAVFLGRPWHEICRRAPEGTDWEAQRDTLERREPFKAFIYPLKIASGATHWFESSGSPRFDEAGTFLGYTGVARDVTEDVENQEKLRAADREARLQQTLLAQIGHISRIGVWWWRLSDNHLDWSDEIYRIYELPVGSEIVLERAFDPYQGEARVALDAAIEASLQTLQPFDVTTRFVTMKGNSRWVRAIGVPEVHEGDVVRLFGTFQDVTEQRDKQLEMQRLAMTDTLTGIGNRAAFNAHLDDLVRAQGTSGKVFALCLIDLNDFKQANDQYGHDVGDEVLRRFADQISAAIDGKGFLARIGGDEFAIIVERQDTWHDIEQDLKDLLSDFKIEIRVHDISFTVSIAAGYALSPADGLEAKTLLRRADLALYEAKSDGPSNVRAYEPSMEMHFQRRVLLTQEFRQALRRGEILPHYQPVVELSTGRIMGLEGLARWSHSTEGLLSPEVFMDVFDDESACIELTDSLLEQICRDMQDWRRRGVHFGRLGLNITSANLSQPGFPLKVIDLLSRHDLQPGHLVLEMTETTVFGGAAGLIMEHVRQLYEAGVFIALDDFGTGYSSLTHLKSVPFNLLKIDKSFVKDMMRSKADRAIVRSLIDLGRDVGYTTIAEGVELQAEAEHLRKIGCECAQGFLFYKPMPKPRAERILSADAARMQALAGKTGKAPVSSRLALRKVS